MKFSQFKNAIGFIFGKPHTVYAHYGITHRCNLNCYMCQVKGDAEYRELSLGRIYSLAKNLARLGISYISIGGGEPLVRDDLTEAVRIFKKHSIRTRLLTNGVLLSESLARKLQISGLSDLSVSLDSLDREKYKYITGTDCLTGVMDAITVARKYFKNGVNLLNTVVSKINIEELPVLSIFAKEHRFKISLIPIENARDNFTLQDKEKIANILNSLDRKHVFNSTNFIRLLPDYLCGSFKNTECLA
ncbi:MAG: radical SAM protein, partial [Candidatus Omnitrophica bacterium]|nr:radical SAM protein [Candidatus Omnitrophota bacterium]